MSDAGQAQPRRHRIRGLLPLLAAGAILHANVSASTPMKTDPDDSAAAAVCSATEETLRMRVHGDASLPTLIYLPGVHGDWTLIGSLRTRLQGKVRFVEITYPRTVTWSLDDYAAAVEGALLANGITSGTLLAESYGSQVAWALNMASNCSSVIPAVWRESSGEK